MDKDSYYFPHFYNARNDRKIRRLRKQLGIEGYGIYFMILEVLRDQVDFKYPVEDIDLLADEFGTSEEKVNVVIHQYKLFNIDKDSKFFSPKFLVYLGPYLKMKEQRRQAGLKSGEARRKKAKKTNGRSTVVQRNVNGDEQSKVKESKVKESKVKESKVNQSVSHRANDEQNYFFNQIIFNAQVELFESDVKKTLKSAINYILQNEKQNSIEKLKMLELKHIDLALDRYKKVSEDVEIKSPIRYLAKCLVSALDELGIRNLE